MDAVLPQPAAASHANAHRIQSLGRCAGRRSRGRALPVAQATFGRASPAHTTRRVDRTSLVPDLFSHDTERDFTHDAHATALLTLEALKRRHLHRLCIRCGLTKRGQIRHRSSTSASGGVTQSDPEQLADQSTAHQALNIGLDAVHTTQNSVHGEISVWHVRARAIGRKADCASGVGRRDDQAIS